MNFVLDIDGTITFHGRPVDEKVIQTIERIMAVGHQVVLASARPIRDIRPVINERLWHMPMVGGNGAIVYNNAKLVAKHCIDTELYHTVIELADKSDIQLLVDDEWDYAYSMTGEHRLLQWIDGTGVGVRRELKDFTTPIKMLLMEVPEAHVIRESVEKLPLTIHGYKSEPMIDLMAEGVDKLFGVRALNIDEYICFGNDDNDVVLFENAKYCVQVGEHDALSALSDESITADENVIENVCAKLLMLAGLE